MGHIRYYARMYGHQTYMRTYGIQPRKFLTEVLACYPECYQLMPQEKGARSLDPWLIIFFKKNRKTGVVSLEWTIRGFERFAMYHPTSIYIPREPIHFAPDEDRSQIACFTRLLDVGYRTVTLEELFERYGMKLND